MKRLILLAVMFATPASAEWTAANPAVAEAAKDPRVAAVLKVVEELDVAIVTGDKAGFVSRFSERTIVNSPFNNVVTADVAAKRFADGVIAYKYLRRSIEYAAPRRDDEVVLMGEEILEPREGAPNAGKTVRRRFTDLWRLDGGAWKLSLRQATVFSVE